MLKSILNWWSTFGGVFVGAVPGGRVEVAIKACSRCGSDYSATYTMCPKCGNREGQGELAVMKLGVGTTGKLRASDRKFKVVSTGCNEEVDIEFLDRSKERITIKEADLTNSAIIDPSTLPPSDEDDEPDVPFMGMGLYSTLTGQWRLWLDPIEVE